MKTGSDSTNGTSCLSGMGLARVNCMDSATAIDRDSRHKAWQIRHYDLDRSLGAWNFSFSF